MSESVLITGGAGYIGSVISWVLHQNGYKVVILDRNIGNSYLQRWANFEQIDLLNMDALKAVFEKNQFSAVIHCAALTSVFESQFDPFKYYLNNFQATLGLLKTMIDFGVKNIIFSSSAAVYGLGGQNLQKLSENSLCKPISPYGRSKLFAEHILADFNRSCGLKYVILRYFNVAGALIADGLKLGEAHSPETHLIPLVIKKIKQNEPIEVFGSNQPGCSGGPIRDYVHVLDVALANLNSLKLLKQDNSHGVLNVCSGIGTSVLEVIAYAQKRLSSHAIIRHMSPRSGDPAFLVGSTDRVKKVLDLAVSASTLEKIIDETVIFSEGASSLQN